MRMSSPEEKNKRRQRRLRVRSEIAKSLEEPKFRQRIKEDKKKKPIDVTKLTHRELVELIREKENYDDNL